MNTGLSPAGIKANIEYYERLAEKRHNEAEVARFNSQQWARTFAKEIGSMQNMPDTMLKYE